MKLNSKYLAVILTCRDWIIFLIAKLNIFIPFWFLGNVWLFDWNSGFPCGSAGKESSCNVGRPGFDPWVGKIPWRRERLPTPVFWPREFHGLIVHGDGKELDTTEWFSLSLSSTSYILIHTYIYYTYTHTHTQASLVAQFVKNPPAMKETQVPSLGQEDPLEKGMQSTPVFSPGDSMDRGVWLSTIHGVTKRQTRLSD